MEKLIKISRVGRVTGSVGLHQSKTFFVRPYWLAGSNSNTNRGWGGNTLQVWFHLWLSGNTWLNTCVRMAVIALHVSHEEWIQTLRRCFNEDGPNLKSNEHTHLHAPTGSQTPDLLFARRSPTLACQGRVSDTHSPSMLHSLYLYVWLRHENRYKHAPGDLVGSVRNTFFTVLGHVEHAVSHSGIHTNFTVIPHMRYNIERQNDNQSTAIL